MIKKNEILKKKIYNSKFSYNCRETKKNKTKWNKNNHIKTESVILISFDSAQNQFFVVVGMKYKSTELTPRISLVLLLLTSQGHRAKISADQ